MMMIKDTRPTKSDSENRNYFQCYHNNIGFCKFKEHCRYQHYKEICSKIFCKDKECKYRHPKTCKNGGECRFHKKKSCLYNHQMLKYKDWDVKEKVQLEKDIKELEKEIVKLKKTNDEKEKQLVELSNTNTDLNKIILDLKAENSKLKDDVSKNDFQISKFKDRIDSKILVMQTMEKDSQDKENIIKDQCSGCKNFKSEARTKM